MPRESGHPVRRGFSYQSLTSVITHHPLSRLMTTNFELTRERYFFFVSLGFGSGFSACGSKPI